LLSAISLSRLAILEAFIKNGVTRHNIYKPFEETNWLSQHFLQGNLVCQIFISQRFSFIIDRIFSAIKFSLRKYSFELKILQRKWTDVFKLYLVTSFLKVFISFWLRNFTSRASCGRYKTIFLKLVYPPGTIDKL